VRRDPVPFETLLDADMWAGILFEERFDFQATMFQPIGGIDRIPMAFARKLGVVVHLGSEVTEIRRTASGVRIVYRKKRSGREASIEGTYCIVTIPLKVLDQIDADFSPPYRTAIHSVEYANAVKIAWQARRFWETEDHIYGGISWVKGPTTLVWYPSDRFFSPHGILMGAYATGEAADLIAAHPLAAQFEMTRAAIEGLHPGHGAELQKPMSIVWSKVPYSLGIAARYSTEQDSNYAMLSEPDGPFYFAGEHLSHIGAWQEGAILSARRAINMIDKHRRATKLR
jgi:monoamine oxidase